MSIWDKFYPQQADQATLDQLMGQSSSGTTIDPRALGQQQGSSAGGLSHSQLGQLFGSGLISPSQLQGILASLQPLTPTEQAELEQLKVDYANQIKSAKLAAFKRLHSDMRQFVINAISWNENLKEINDAGNVPKSERHAELEQKAQSGRFLGPGQYVGSPSYSPNMTMDFSQFIKLINLPDGITADELKQSHLEATLEEEMLNGQES